jgi:hypothetical protein
MRFKSLEDESYKRPSNMFRAQLPVMMVPVWCMIVRKQSRESMKSGARSPQVGAEEHPGTTNISRVKVDARPKHQARGGRA